VRIRVEDIPDEGLWAEFTCRPRPEELGVQVSDGGEVVARLRVTKRGEMVIARGRVEARVVVSCSRCLKPVEMALGEDVEFIFEPPPTDAPEELELSGQELMVDFYQGEEIDLGQAVVAEVGLWLPMAPVCAPDCPGLCPVCGRPLAEGDCGCRKKEIDPRWAKLAQLKLE